MRWPGIWLVCLLFSVSNLGAESLEEALAWSRQQLREARQSLTETRDAIVEEKLPLARELRELRLSLSQQQENKRLLDERRKGGDFEVGQLNSKNKIAGELAVYLENQAIRYRQAFEVDLVSGERSSQAEKLLAMDTAHVGASAPLERAMAQWQVIEKSFDRLAAVPGGIRFKTEAVSENGVLEKGEAIGFGPLVFFKADTGEFAGNLQVDDHLQPRITALDQDHGKAVGRLFSGDRVRIPIDPTLGQASLIEQEAVSFKEHLVRGGFWMIPICIFGIVASLTGVLKWISLQRVQLPGIKEFEKLRNPASGNLDRRYRGEVRTLLTHILSIGNEAPAVQAAELDVAYQEFKFSLNRWLSVIALTAGVSPLLGLLGTVTGMIKTFQLISLFGAGDAKLLSSGISEALITTEFGLIVAIPALVLHAYLQRRVKKILVQSAGLLEQVSRGVAS